jgi:hypothetical protein
MEMGDVYVDLFMCLPIVLQRINLNDVNARIKEKIKAYSDVLDRILKDKIVANKTVREVEEMMGDDLKSASNYSLANAGLKEDPEDLHREILNKLLYNSVLEQKFLKELLQLKPGDSDNED